jgi:hypothetical protein
MEPKFYKHFAPNGARAVPITYSKPVNVKNNAARIQDHGCTLRKVCEVVCATSSIRRRETRIQRFDQLVHMILR